MSSFWASLSARLEMISSARRFDSILSSSAPSVGAMLCCSAIAGNRTLWLPAKVVY